MKIVAIGGGEIGRLKDDGTRYPIETRAIDKEIIRLSGKVNPNVLFLPTASNDSSSYYDVIQRYYGKMLGCKTDVLYLTRKKMNKKEIQRKIDSSDIIYVGGGNTMKMLKVWRTIGVDKMLEKAGNEGKVLSGVSAGAICWFKYCNSDSLKTNKDDEPKLIRLKGLGFLDLNACPHYDAEASRRPGLHDMVKVYGGKWIALENCSAIEIVDGSYRIITSSKDAKAYLVYRNKGKVFEKEIEKHKELRPLEQLVLK